MPEAQGLASQEVLCREPPQLSGSELVQSEQHPSMAQHRSPPALYCAQQSPHRVQSSTNLDLVDCVGSDLLLAMSCLDVGDQTRGSRASRVNSNTDTHNEQHCLTAAHGFSPQLSGSAGLGTGGTEMSTSTSSPPIEDFLPLAALAPPPQCQPSWLISQQQQARAQHELFPSRVHSHGDSERHSRGSVVSNNEQDGVTGERRSDQSCFNIGGGSTSGGRIRVDDNGRDFSSQGANNSLCGNGPGTPGATFVAIERSHSRGPSPGGGRRPRGGAAGGTVRGSLHLDESWTAVLNAPAGAELMEFLTEKASRALVLWNVESMSEDALRAACEVYGPLYYLRAEHQRWKCVVFIAYYDIRDAVNAHQSLGRDLLQLLFQDGSRPLPAVHFSVELHAGFSHKEGSLLVHDLPTQATEADVGSVFQTFGDLQGTARHSGSHQGHPGSFVVDFCSIQDARIAAQELMIRNPWGPPITVEPALRSESERTLGRQLHATLNRWTAEATQAKAAEVHASAMFADQQQQHVGVLSVDERMRSSASAVLSGRSSDSDSPPPKPEDYPHELVYMDSYTPMTSANTTPATTPSSTPPSGADAYHYMVPNGGKSPAMYLTVPQQHQCNNGPSRIHGGQVPTTPGNLIHLRTGSCPGPTSIVSPGAHQLFAAGSAGPTPPPPPHHGHMGGGGGPPGHHHHAPRMPPSQHMHLSAPPDQQHMVGGGSGVKPHPLASSPGRGPSPYGSSPGNTFYVDVSPAYHVDCDDDRTPHTPMWPASSSLSPPSVRSGGNGNAGMRSSPPLRGMPGGVLGCHGCHGGPGGPGGLGYKDRARQSSLDEGRMSSTAGGGGGCGVRNMRCNSDGGQMTVSQNPGCGGNNGDEFSLDLKKVSKGLDKRTTIMIRNIPNKYTQAMLLQEIDASYRGAYDFFYLPIDFKNKCNVGYAFINFIDYRRIVPFFREFNGQRWKNFNSEKVCAISYARIQGKASMISRFQNSSLMEKDGEYRPLIFHSSGTERGRPEPFPASSKVLRGSATPTCSSGSMGHGSARDRERSMSSSSSHV